MTTNTSQPAQYMLSKQAYVGLASTNIEHFIAKHYGMEGVDEYSRLRSVNIKDPTSLSLTIPWVLADLCGVKANNCIELAAAWESIVLYVLQLDQISDKSQLTSLDKKLMLLASTLFARGIDQLRNLLGNDSLDHLAPLFQAASFQKRDMECASDESRMQSMGEIEHLELMKGKNVFTKVLSPFYLSRSNVNRDLLERFIDHLATSAQIIDDIKDIDEDVRNSSYSHILSALNRSQEGVVDSFTRTKMLIETGVLKRSALLADSYLEKGVGIAKEIYRVQGLDAEKQNFELMRYLSEARENIQDLVAFITELEISGLTDAEQERILDNKINGLIFST